MADEIEEVDASIVALNERLELLAATTRDETELLLGNYSTSIPTLQEIYGSISNRQKLAAMLVPLTATKITLRSSIVKVDMSLVIANRIMEVAATRLMRHHSSDPFLKYRSNLSALDPILVEQLHAQLLRQQQRAALEGRLANIEGMITLIQALLSVNSV